MAFVDVEKAFNRVGVEEWLVRLKQSMYENARSRVSVGCNLSEEFIVKVSVHKGSSLIPLLFITVLKAFSQEFCIGCPWENLNADDLVIIFELLEKLQEKLILSKI